jgi:hypothetical protein
MNIQHYAPITCYIPQSFNPVTDVPCYNKRWHEKYVYMVHTILFHSLRNKQTFNGYVNLQGDILQKFLGQRYANHVINQLVNGGIIEINKKYSSGNFSKSYRLTHKFTKGIKLKREEIAKQSYCRKLMFQQQRTIQTAFKENPLLVHEFHQLTRRRIDVAAAVDYINTNYKEGTPQHAARILAVEQFDAMKETSFSNTLSKPVGFHFTFNKGRVYSPVTSLPRDLETFTYFDDYLNERSASLDMPNSQLCFFHEYTKRSIHKSHNIGSVLDEEIDRIRLDDNLLFSGGGANTKSLINSLYSSPYDMTIKQDFGVFDEQPTWADYIFSGKGYERMMFLMKWKGKYSDWNKDERQEFKAEFFGQLFYNRWLPKLTPMELVFMENHESEAILLRAVKKRLGSGTILDDTGKKKLRGNALLAIQVQKLEAHLFHTIIVDHMKRNYSDIPFTIKHDSVTMPASAAAYIAPELDKLVQKFFGVQWIGLKCEQL